jgi:DASH complex subunit Dad2
MSFNRPLPSHLRHGSTSLGQNSTGQSPALLARINEKKAELANLKDLQALSAALADQMQMLEDKLATLADGTEGALIYSREVGTDRILMVPWGCSCSRGAVKLA